MHDLNEELIELRVDVDKNYSNTGKWVEYVNKLINHGYHDEALEAIQEACTINSSSPELFVIYIKLLKELKLKEKSRYLIADCAQNFPNNFTLQLLYGESLKQQKQFEQALRVFKHCQSINDRSIWSYIHSAKTLQRLGDLENSYEEILIAHQINPKHSRMQFTKAQIEHELGKDLAFNSYEQVISLDSKHPLAEKSAIEILKFVKNEKGVEAALKESKKQLKHLPESLDVNLFYAQCLNEVSSTDEAHAELNKILEKWPGDVPSILLLIRILNLKEQQSAALQLLIDQLDVFPNSFPLMIHLGHQYRLMSKRKMALESFEQAFELGVNDKQKFESLLKMVVEHKIIGNYQLAIETLNKAKQYRKENTRLQLLDAELRIKVNRPKEAQSIYQSILDNDRGSVKAVIGLSNLYSLMGHGDKAIELLRTRLETNQGNAHLQISLAQKLSAFGDNNGAIELYKEILVRSPDNARALIGLAQSRMSTGQWNEAIGVLETCIIPEHKNILLKKADILMRLGKFDQATEVIRLIRKKSDDPNALFKQAKILSNQGLFEQANQILDSLDQESNIWKSKVNAAKGNNYFLQYRYKEAAQAFETGIQFSENPLHLRNRLALLYMLEGKLAEARALHEKSTKEIEQRSKGGKIRVPLKSHSALVINDLRSNPDLLQVLIKTFELKGENRLKAIAELVFSNPFYLGSSIYLMRELRTQGIFGDFRPTERQPVPKVIVQYWDQDRRPDEVVQMMNSWKEENPEYEHKVYSMRSAYEFLKREYNQHVVRAFKNCEGPAMQADFFRLAYLYKFGGFYADADDMCVKGLDEILSFELVVLQEDFATIGNNFIGAIPSHPVIKFAFDCVVQNLSEYCNENAWFKTGPAILTNAMAIYISQYIISDEQMPSVKVLSISELRSLINQHMPMSYKRTNKSWSKQAYERDIKISI